jgi:general secretion pathway protein G
MGTRSNARSDNGATKRSRRALSRGFTLIELLIVMVLLVLLAGVSLAVYGNSVKRGKETALKEDLFQMRKAIDEYYADKGKYPSDLQTLVSEKYLRSIAPDPFTGSADTWQPVPSDLDPGNPSAEPGISDVKSGSDQTGSDGKPYSEWE